MTTISQMRKKVGDDLYRSVTESARMRSWLVDQYVSKLTDEEVKQALA